MAISSWAACYGRRGDCFFASLLAMTFRSAEVLEMSVEVSSTFQDASQLLRTAMFVVGLTGGIASGKTTVSRMFSELGVPVICADELAHAAVRPNSPGLGEIRRAFGDDLVDPKGSLDRAAMARLVFNDESARKRLEAIVHPRVLEEQNKKIAELAAQGHNIAVVDVPLLYESGLEGVFDLIIVVYVPRNFQEDRLMRRDNMSRKEARLRLDAQMSIEEKKNRADRIVDNTGRREAIRKQVEALVEELRSLAGSRRVDSVPAASQGSETSRFPVVDSGGAGKA